MSVAKQWYRFIVLDHCFNEMKLYQLYPMIKPKKDGQKVTCSSTKMGIVLQVITVDLLTE